MKSLSVSDKKAQRDLLMKCVLNCGYEFDNEQLFNSNKKVLLSMGRSKVTTLGMTDVGEE
jgi:hypothetical protein